MMDVEEPKVVPTISAEDKKKKLQEDVEKSPIISGKLTL